MRFCFHFGLSTVQMRLQIFLLVIFLAVIYKCHCQSNTTQTPGWNWETNYQIEDPPTGDDDNYGDDNNNNDGGYDNNNNDGYNNNNDDGYNNNNNNNNNNNDDSDGSAPSKGNNNGGSETRSKRRRKSPDEYANINLYFRDSSKGSKSSKRPKKMRFPVHRFDRRRAPSFSPLLSFLPWLPIFADRLTKQTIIFSPIGGVYIIPPVINFYGKLFSVAELIASGYCSLVSSGAPPPPALDVAPLVQPGAVAGVGIPPANLATGGFTGGVKTKFRSFPPKYPGTVEDQGYASGGRSQGSGKGYGY